MEAHLGGGKRPADATRRAAHSGLTAGANEVGGATNAFSERNEITSSASRFWNVRSSAPHIALGKRGA